MKLKKALAAAFAAIVTLTLIPAAGVSADYLPVADGYTRYECEKGDLQGGCTAENISTRAWAPDASGAAWVTNLSASSGGMNSLTYDFGTVRHVEIHVTRAERGVVTLKVGYMSVGKLDPSNNVVASCNYFAVKVNETGAPKEADVKNAVISAYKPWQPSPGDTLGYLCGVATVQAVMDAGDNTVYISQSLSGGWVNLDYLDVGDATDTNQADIDAVEPPQTPVAPGGNPFITSIYTADPSAHVWKDGRLYVYPSHDMDTVKSANTVCDRMDRYHVYSTDNMVDWRDEGEIWNRSDIGWDGTPSNIDYSNNAGTGLPSTFMWAPDAAYKDGKYYFYYPYPANVAQQSQADANGDYWNSTWTVGVLVSDFPDKDFTSLGFVHNSDGTVWRHGASFIDPCVFQDDDGQYYLFEGGGGRAWQATLSDDMITVKDNSTAQVSGTGSPNGSPLTDYHEGPWIFKRDGIYYFTYPGSGGSSAGNRMLYATSASINGPWKYRGYFLEHTDCDTSHGSVVEFKGHWYMFYHNMNLSGQTNLRSIACDELFFNDDGTIRTVQQTTTGPDALGPREDPGPVCDTYEAESAVSSAAVQLTTAAGASGGQSVRVQAADTVTFNNVSGGTNGGRATMRFCFASSGKARWNLTVNGKDWSMINLLSSGGIGFYTQYADFTVPLNAGGSNTITVTSLSGQVFFDKLEVFPFNDANETAPKLTGIEMKTLPEKTAYMAGDAFTVAGAAITIKYADGTAGTLPLMAYMASGYSDTPGAKTITVIYKENNITQTTTFPVTVSANPISAIAVTTPPNSVMFLAGDTFSTAGGKLTMTHDTGEKEIVDLTESMCSGYDMSPSALDSTTTPPSSVQTVTVTNMNQTASYTITVLSRSRVNAWISMFNQLGGVDALTADNLDSVASLAVVYHAMYDVEKAALPADDVAGLPAMLQKVGFLYGDVNTDGAVNTVDARLILQSIVGKADLNDMGDAARLAADVDGNGKIDTVDARLILQFVVGKIRAFPAE